MLKFNEEFEEEVPELEIPLKENHELQSGRIIAPATLESVKTTEGIVLRIQDAKTLKGFELIQNLPQNQDNKSVNLTDDNYDGMTPALPSNDEPSVKPDEDNRFEHIAPDGTNTIGTLQAIVAMLGGGGAVIALIIRLIEGDTVSGAFVYVFTFLQSNMFWIVLLVLGWLAYKMWNKKLRNDHNIEQMKINANPDLPNVQVVAGKKGDPFWKIW